MNVVQDTWSRALRYLLEYFFSCECVHSALAYSSAVRKLPCFTTVLPSSELDVGSFM